MVVNITIRNFGRHYLCALEILLFWIMTTWLETTTARLASFLSFEDIYLGLIERLTGGEELVIGAREASNPP
jgi:hypothetical protein